MTGKHECAAIGCTYQINNAFLMCRKHWMQVPKPLRDAIYATVNQQPRRDYYTNVREAVRLVRERELDRQLRRLYDLAYGAPRAEFEVWMATPTELVDARSPSEMVELGKETILIGRLEGLIKAKRP